MAQAYGASAIVSYRRGYPPTPGIVRLVGAMLLEQNDEWAVQRPT